MPQANTNPQAPNAPAQVDVVSTQSGSLVAQGDVAMRLMQNNFNVEALRTQDFLRKDDWLHFDNTVIEIARATLVGVADVISAGLTLDVPNALGVTRIEWERMGDMGPAELNMAGVTEGRNDTIQFDLVGMPLPIVHKDFWINIRKLEASRNSGMPLDTTQAAICARKVSEKIESMLWDGDTSLGTNNTIYGYTTATDRITGSKTDHTWANGTGAMIIADATEMVAAAKAKEMRGPFQFYVSYGAMSNLGNDFKAESDKTILQRLLEVPGVAGVKETSYLTNGEVVAVQMSRDVVDIVDGLQPTVVQWPSLGGMVQNFKVMAIMVPRIKSTITGQSGIIHYSLSGTPT